jgi:hypothetical protein
MDLCASTHYFWSMRHLDRALAYGQRAVALAAPFDDIGLDAHAHFDLAEVHYSLGHYYQAIMAFEQLVARFTGDRLYERIGVAMHSVVSRRWLVQALAETGAFAAGIARGEEGIRIAETADHPYSLFNICLGLAICMYAKEIFSRRSPSLRGAWNSVGSGIFAKTLRTAPYTSVMRWPYPDRSAHPWPCWNRASRRSS